MKKQKTTLAKFTKQKMIDDINSLRKKTMESQVVKTEIAQTYQTLYNYKVVDKLIELGFLKLSEKKGKASYYKWNFDTKVDLELSDALYVNVLAYRRNLTRKYAEHKIIQNNKKELIKSQEKATSDLFLEVKEEKQLPRLEKMSFAQQLMSPDELARDLGLVPSEEEIQGWKDEIKNLKSQIEKKSIYIKELLGEIKRKDDYVYSMSFKHQDDLKEQEKRYEKLLSEKALEPTFVPKEEDKKPFVAVLGEIKKQEIENKKPTKYLKLFGYMIYEKN